MSTEIGEESESPEAKLPYVSWTTLNGLFKKLEAGPIPPRIDKGYLETYSGGTQAILLVALRSFSLVDKDGKVSQELVSLASDEEWRKAYLREQLDRLYPEPLELAKQNATSQQLEESFRRRGFQGSTLRKAIAFYLDLVKYLDAPTSPFFKVPKSPGTSTPRRTPSSRGTKRTSTQEQPNGGGGTGTSGTKGEQFIVDFGGAGRVTVNVEVRWLELDDELFMSLRRITNELRALGSELTIESALAEMNDSEDSD